MLKRFLCLSLVIILCFSLVGCSFGGDTEYPLKLVDEVRDQYDNVLQQTFDNEETGDYMLREYTYQLERNKWVCVDQRMTVMPYVDTTTQPQPSAPVTDPTLKIYFNSDLADGPITIMNNENVKISVVKYLAADNWWEFGYELKVVNKTNKVLTVMVDCPSIMSISCEPLFSIDHIDAGDTAYFTLAWDRDTLERCDIPYIDNVEFIVRVYDNENWRVPALYGERVLLKN
jgi:hypothetical protein